MRRGKAPTPKRQLQGRGSWRAKDRPDDLELQSEIPNPPTTLGREARAEWRRLVGVLGPSGALSRVDRAGLTILCELWAEERELTAVIEGRVHGRRLIFGTASWKRVVAARNAVRVLWVKMAGNFGITPADRARIKVNPGAGRGGRNPKDRFFPPNKSHYFATGGSGCGAPELAG